MSEVTANTKGNAPTQAAAKGLAGLLGDLGNTVTNQVQSSAIVDIKKNAVLNHLEDQGYVQVEEGGLNVLSARMFSVGSQLLNNTMKFSNNQALIARIDELGISALMDPAIANCNDIAKAFVYGRIVNSRGSSTVVDSSNNRRIGSAVLHCDAKYPEGSGGIPAWDNTQSEFFAKTTSPQFAGGDFSQQSTMVVKGMKGIESVQIRPITLMKMSNGADKESSLQMTATMVLNHPVVVNEDGSEVRKVTELLAIFPFGTAAEHKTVRGSVTYTQDNAMIESGIVIPLRVAEYQNRSSVRYVSNDLSVAAMDIVKTFFATKCPKGINTISSKTRLFTEK